MITGRLIENCQIVSAAPMADWNNDYTGDWVSMKNYNRCLVLFNKNAGTAGDDPSIVLEQASDVSGTGAKALNFTHIYHKIGATALSAIGTFTKVNLTTVTNDLDLVSVNSTDMLADVGETLIGIEVHSSDLDVSGGFDCLRVSSTGADIGNAVYGVAFYILYDPRFSQNSCPSAIAD